MRRKKVSPDKYRRNEIDAVVQALTDVIGKGVHLDKALLNVMKSNSGWNQQARKFVASSVIDIVRYFRLYAKAVGTQEVTRQNIFHFLSASLIRQKQDIPYIPPFKKVEKEPLVRAIRELQKERVLAESYPDWLYKQGRTELGNSWDSLAHALNEEPPIILRANLLKVTPEQLIEVLHEENVDAFLMKRFPDAVELKFRMNVFRLQAFKEGLFEVQDPASQMVSHSLDVRPGMRVVDACAGAGGKTLHIAALMRNKGKLIALDTIEPKLQDLKKRASRSGASIIETRVIDSAKVIKRLHESADRLLLDVPCSGTGVLRRNPDSKWTMKPTELKSLYETQERILDQYSPIVKPGGRIVYSTCSVLPSESEDKIDQFLSTHPDYKLLSEKRYWTDKDGTDTFYIAVLEREGKSATGKDSEAR